MGKNFKFFFKILEGIRLHWRDLIFKVTLCNQFKFLVFDNIKKVFRRFTFTQANNFLLKKDFNKNWYFMSQILKSNARPTHPFASIWQKLWKDLICEWPLKQTGHLVFA